MTEPENPSGLLFGARSIPEENMRLAEWDASRFSAEPGREGHIDDCVPAELEGACYCGYADAKNAELTLLRKFAESAIAWWEMLHGERLGQEFRARGEFEKNLYAYRDSR